MKISFINAVAQICERSEADVVQVAEGMGLDPRIGRAFLNAGAGFGGFCLAPEESTFVLNSPHVRVQPIERLFNNHSTGGRVGKVDVAVPLDGRILSFDERRHTATVTPVRCLTRRWYDGPFIHIETLMGRQLRVTADHPIMVADPATAALRIAPACQVRAGDHLVSPMVLPPLQPVRSIDLLGLLSRQSVALPVKVLATDASFGRIYRAWGRRIPRTLTKSPYDMVRRRVMPWAVWTWLRGRTRIASSSRLRLFTSKGHTTTIPARFAVDEPFMRWLGYYLAEGWIARDAGRNGAVRERTGLRQRQPRGSTGEEHLAVTS
jgi:UDPglucose 6-dehydrogenase